jgi:N-acetylglucosaminyldiphosphoundecaprenol N-acetyl-beta-D-mannosaminyltransferase
VSAGQAAARRAQPQAGGRRSVLLLGVRIDALTMDETVGAARAMVRSRLPHQHVGVNAALLVESERNPELRRVIRESDLVSADGISTVLAGRMFGQPLPARVAGVDLFQRLVEAAHEDNSSVYFLGATDEVVERVAARFSGRYPGLRIAGYRNGYWNDDLEVVGAVRAARPDYLFLAIPSPQKELWLSRHLHDLGVPFAMGVGGSFDVVAGKVTRAPRWVQNAGFEWAWRLGQEPRRMWRRYLFSNAAFVRSLAREYWQAQR